MVMSHKELATLIQYTSSNSKFCYFEQSFNSLEVAKPRLQGCLFFAQRRVHGTSLNGKATLMGPNQEKHPLICAIFFVQEKNLSKKFPCAFKLENVCFCIFYSNVSFFQVF